MNKQNKKAIFVIGLLTVVVLGLVTILYSGVNLRETFDANYPNFDKKMLPLWNAIFNFLVFGVLIMAYRAIRAKKIEQHRRWIYLACILSTLFLLNYVFYHSIADSTKYGGTGWLRGVYFILLLTHVVLAAVSFPFIVYTAFLGHTMQVDAHRKMTKWVFPIWLYVALSGVLVYLFISPYYV